MANVIEEQPPTQIKPRL